MYFYVLYKTDQDSNQENFIFKIDILSTYINTCTSIIFRVLSMIEFLPLRLSFNLSVFFLIVSTFVHMAFVSMLCFSFVHWVCRLDISQEVFLFSVAKFLSPWLGGLWLRHRVVVPACQPTHTVYVQLYTVPKIQVMYSAASVTNPAFMCLLAIYIFPGPVHLFGCSKIDRPVLEIYKSLTDIWV